jgi:hypothetical protein
VLGFVPFAGRAAEIGDLADALAFDPPTWDFDNVEIRLGGFAEGALFAASQGAGPAYPGGYDYNRGSGVARANIRAQRIFDNGMILGARSDFLLYHDALSGDNYNEDTIEKLYLFAQTGFGRVEIGQQDGAGFQLGLTGPVVDSDVSPENRNISLFRDPTTGGDFAGFFEHVTAVQATSNFAKINYVTPRLFGVQVAASYTPYTVRAPLPFGGNPTDNADRQQNIWEAAVNYTTYFSDIAVGLSAGYAHGSLANRTSGTEDLSDWSLGAQLAYTISDVKLSLGGAYRDTNAYLLDVNQVFAGGHTHAAHVSAMIERGSWLFGGEYSTADIDGPTNFAITGYQLTAGYKINSNMQISAGWQWYNYGSTGVFYNGDSRIGLNAGFLSLSYSL